MAEEEQVCWSVDLEIGLFQAMRKHKPVGVNRHFQMIIIHDRLNGNHSTKKISCKQIWERLGTLYDLETLNESEIVPFPNKEKEFSLPEDEFREFLHKDSHNKSADTSLEEAPKTTAAKTSSSNTTPSPVAPTMPATPDPKRKRTRQSHTPGEQKRARRT